MLHCQIWVSCMFLWKFDSELYERAKWFSSNEQCKIMYLYVFKKVKFKFVVLTLCYSAMGCYDDKACASCRQHQSSLNQS